MAEQGYLHPIFTEGQLGNTFFGGCDRAEKGKGKKITVRPIHSGTRFCFQVLLSIPPTVMHVLQLPWNQQRIKTLRLCGRVTL